MGHKTRALESLVMVSVVGKHNQNSVGCHRRKENNKGWVQGVAIQVRSARSFPGKDVGRNLGESDQEFCNIALQLFKVRCFLVV